MERIKIQIFGNPIRHAGARLLLDSSAPFGLEYAGLPGISLSPYAIEIKVQPTYTFYKLVRNNVITSDGNQGTLVIGMSIPADHQVSMGKTPLDVLLDIWEKFKTTYMRPSLGAAIPDSYTYKPIEELIAADFFQDVLNKYPLEKVSAPYYQMNGSGKCALSLSMMEMREFTRDVSNYECLSKFESVVIAEKMDETHYVESLTGRLEIPRKRAFKIYAPDGTVTTVADFDRSIVIYSAEDERCYERAQVCFTIRDLLAGNVPQGIVFDPKNETIRCNIKGAEKRVLYKISLKVAAGCRLRESDCLRALSLAIGRKPLPIIGGNSFYLVGEDNLNVTALTLTISIPNCKLEDKRINTNTRELVVLVSEIQQPRPQVPTLSSATASPTLFVKVTPSSAIDNDTFWFKMEKEGKFRYEGALNFTAQGTAGKNKKERVAAIPLPEMVGKESFQISLHTEKKTTSPKNFSYRDKANEITFNVDEMKPIATFAAIYKSVCAVLAPILLVAAVVVYFLFWPKEPQQAIVSSEPPIEYPKGGDVKKTEETDSTNVTEGNKKEAEAELKEPDSKTKEEEAKAKAEAMKKEIEDYFASVEKKLNKDNLSFDEVKTLYTNNLSKSQQWSNEQAWKDSKRIIDKLKAYKKVVDVLTRECKTQEELFVLAEDIIDLRPGDQVMQALNEKHRIEVLYIFWGDYSVNPPKEYACESLKESRNGGYRICPPGAKADYDNNMWGVEWFLKKRVEKKYNTFKSLEAFKNKRSYIDMLY